MGRLLKCNWLLYCLLIFVVSRLIMLYQYNLANEILAQAHNSFFTAMCRWDCKWYMTIIEHGYDLLPRTSPKIWKGLANWAFFPLYPYTVKGVVSAISTPVVATGIILNQLFVFLSLCVFYKYLRLKFDELNSRFGVFLLGFSPFGIYFTSLYTEAMFLLLSLLAFYFMVLKKPYISAIFGGLLSATRPVGVMFAIPYVYNLWRQSGFRFRLIVCGIISISGLLVYMLYLHYHTGDFLAFKHIQAGWGRKGWDLANLGTQLLNMVKDKHNSIMFLISIGLTVVLFLNKFVEEAMFNLLCILPGFMTGQMMSEGRFSGTLFTFYLGLLLLSKRSKSMKIALSLVFMLLFTSYYLYWMAHANFLI